MKKHPPYFENLHSPFIKGDASYGYIYRNKYLPLHFIFTPPILKILLLFPQGYFIMNPPPPPFYSIQKNTDPLLIPPPTKIKHKRVKSVLSVQSLDHYLLNVISMHRIKFGTISNAFWLEFYKPSPSYPTRLSNLNYIKHTHTLRIT